MLLSQRIRIYFIGHLLLALVGMSAGLSCHYSKQQGYQTADCAGKGLEDVPTTLRPEIEVLDLSMNGLRELHNNTFVCCTSIQLLYLQSNSIYEVESHVFYPLTGLQVLDFSKNVLSELPENLPSNLRRLYLDKNPRLFSSNEDAPLLPISSLTSLEVLRLSSNKLKKFPRFGGNVPSLIELNITDNPFTELSPDDLAPLCQLRYLYLSADRLFRTDVASSSASKQLCDCLKLERWAFIHDIEIKSLVCRKDKSTNMSSCITEPKNTTIAVYESCMADLSARKLPYKVMVISGIVVLLIGIGILLYVRHRRRQRDKLKRSATDSVGSGVGNNSRTPPTVKYDNKTSEEKGPGGRGRAPGAPPSWETSV